MRFFFGTLLSFYAALMYAQEPFNKELNFIFHLSENKLIDDAVFHSKTLLANKLYTEEQKDSLNFIIGKILLSSTADSIAPGYLGAVSINSPFYYPAKFSELDHYLKYKKTAEALKSVSQIDSSTSALTNQVCNFVKAGLYLHSNKLDKFDSLARFFNTDENDLKTEQQNLVSYANINRKLKRRSVFVAGALSAVVPGLGKLYAGNRGQALATFLTVGLMGGITAENYFKQGLKHPQTIIFGVITSVFYIGNIWGSALGVQIVKNEKDLENKHNILVALRMPLRKFFR